MYSNIINLTFKGQSALSHTAIWMLEQQSSHARFYDINPKLSISDGFYDSVKQHIMLVSVHDLTSDNYNITVAAYI